MLSRILEFDAALFNAINKGLSNQLFDFVLVPIRYELFWIPFYVFIIAFILFNHRIYHWTTILAVIACVSASDIVSSHTIKPLVERPRPCHENSQVYPVNLRVRCGSGFSFTSSHATNHFALASVLSFILFRRRKGVIFMLFFWAAAIAFAQVYVGVHYPMDILCGAILGTSLGFIFNQFYISIIETIKHKQEYDIT